MHVLFAASECAPFVKTGGLGDVIGALPKALLKKQIRVSVILPKYADIPDSYQRRMAHLTHFFVPVGWRNQYCGIEYLEEEGIRYYFLDNEYYFKRHGSYGYFDDGERFAYFSRAVLEALPRLTDRPDVIHCHDWQTGPICVLLRSHCAIHPFYQPIKTVFTIHNLQYQGVFPKSVLSDLLDLSDRYFQMNGLEFYGGVSYMKAGLAYADILTTVSQTYAQEIQMPYFGERMDGFLRRRSGSLSGIVNGIDRELYNPATDQQIYVPFEEPDGKRKNKMGLQREMNLPADEHLPIVGMITRLTEQKGIDLVLHVFHELIRLPIQFVLLGTGEKRYESSLSKLARQYPDSVSVNLFFDERLARKIYAGSDLFLMPSKFEPCGIGQLLAMRYGSLPIVRETGGLKDTVMPYNEFSDEGYGFSFTNYNAHDLLYTVERALGFYRLPDKWRDLVRRAMHRNFGWEQSAEAYKNLYASLFI
ncbi:glycogen synthase GlgA [Sporolactobacillus sp. THM7-7]|nr:glycogen synthase GlgA [Sporolactobacillus sp. THM7-7]